MAEPDHQNTYDDAESLEIMDECSKNGRNLGSVILGRQAIRHGATLQWLNQRDVWAVFPDRRVAISGHFGTESALAAGIVSNKHFTKGLLQAAGISVPAGRRVKSAADAIVAQQEIGRPVVIKPTNGAMGHGVTVNVIDAEDIREGYIRASQSGSGVLVEQYIGNSSEYRAHATPTHCVGVFERLLPSVVGDGNRTVAELISDKNNLRQQNPSTRDNPIPLDAVADGFLRRQNLSQSSIPEAGQTVIVRDVNGITSGGDSEECWDSASNELKATAVGAIAAIPGMEWGGVDILVEHATGKPYVIEVNTSAAISGSTYPVFGTPRDLPSVLWQLLYDRSAPSPTLVPSEDNQLFQARSASRSESSFDLSGRPLQALLQDHLEDSGYQITRHNSRIWSAEPPSDHPALWFNAVLSGADLQTAINPLRKRALYRQVLQATKIPRPSGKWIASEADLQDYRRKKQTALELIPARTGLGKNDLIRLQRNQSVADISVDWTSKWFAQVRRSGKRLRVIATSERSLAIVAFSEQTEASFDALNVVSEIACKAVRAVPELRWAVVDILHRSPQHADATSPEVVVEYMSMNPRMPRHGRVVLGSMNEVFAYIVEGAKLRQS